MMFIKKFLLNNRNLYRSTYVWNTIASMSNSFQSMILLLIITRFGTSNDASIFAIGFAVANLMLSIGKFGMRNFQVTDVNNKYTYKEYCFSRIITVILMILVSLGYVLNGYLFNDYTMKRSLAIILVCMMRVIEAIEDVIHGNVQKENRLDIASKIWSIRTISYIIVFSVTYLIKKDLIFSLSISLLITFILMIFLNSIINDHEEDKTKNYNIVKSFALLKDCLPLAIGSFMIMYIGNAPKYIIDMNVSDQVQTCFNIVFMPVFVITLLSSFIFNPLLTRLANLWIDKKIKNFFKLIYRQAAIILLLTVTAVIFGRIIGLKLLEIIYKMDLGGYHLILSMLMIAGGCLALLNLFNVVLIVLRKQILTLIIFSIAFVFLLLGNIILLHTDLTFLCMYYCIVLFVTCLLLFAGIVYSTKK